MKNWEEKSVPVCETAKIQAHPGIRMLRDVVRQRVSEQCLAHLLDAGIAAARHGNPTAERTGKANLVLKIFG